MTRSTTPVGRQRPGGAFGPVRDETRNARIIDAVLDLIVEHGYVDLTMTGVAERAGVAKATVYRRWASREDLVADALESLMLPAAPPEKEPAQSLREDLIATLVQSSAYLHPHARRFSAALAASTAAHPAFTDTLRERYISGQRGSIAACLHRARERGELTQDAVDRLSAPDSFEMAAVLGVLLQQEELLGVILNADEITRLVDDVVLPLVRRSPTE